MELPINTVVILVVLLVLVVVVLILVSRDGNMFTDFGGEKIGIAGDVTECEMICFNCCRGQKLVCDSNSPSDPPATFLNPWQNCGCFGDGTGC